MEFIRKYWWCFIIALIVVPIALNFILLIPAFTPIVGDNQTWLSFIGTLIGALASFVMIFFTAKTLKQNEEQLNELKRQWKEEHTPYLSCQLIAKSDKFLLRVLNSSNVTANSVKIIIESVLFKPKDPGEAYTPHNFDKLKDFLTVQEFVVPPRESLYFTIWITPYAEVNNLPSGYISVSLRDESSDFGVYKLYPQNFAFASFEKENIGNSVVNAISEVGRKIENKTFLFK
ncbi:MAG: DUF4231 domain-containing protein [Paramuribaculum sp.]|nr:DUF4231 domain-containing protein [Paramuribaculum sp.]